ncbi:hypothetical protein DOTSEDRAFT_22685 [Dothistroma septosporum NZE10]|uniref:Uncharacterized protein n=1 Tax=Dothistroma septosporum (strain NZE10 / CBS 128990) TaxID=675120 RepID=N1PWB2_DOTSN|nr:hypothetical protein DOTSEDRAFT_22685 [Dothistroma septosporum NZE10]
MLWCPYIVGPKTGDKQYFFEAARMDDPFLVTITIFVLLIVSIFCSLIVCGRISRRPLLAEGYLLMCLLNVEMATSGLLLTGGTNKAALARLRACMLALAGPISFVAAEGTSIARPRAQTTSSNLGCHGTGFVVSQWTISYINAPDAANLAVNTVYVSAGVLVPNQNPAVNNLP